MKAKTYFHGDGHSKWGIWNNMRKEFQFGICEDTPLLAKKKLFQKIGNDARKWRFEVKKLPHTKIMEYDKLKVDKRNSL